MSTEGTDPPADEIEPAGEEIEEDEGVTMTRRGILQTGAAAGAVAALPAGASAQDTDGDDEDDTDGTTYEPPDQFIGDEANAIGVDRMLIAALKYDESERTPDSLTEATLNLVVPNYSVVPEEWGGGTYYDDPSDLDEAAGNGILQLDRMDSADHHVLLNMFNEIQLARNQAFFEGLSAFLEKVEADASQSETVAATETAGLEHYVTVQTNLATFWKEQVNQLKAYKAYLEESFDWESRSEDLGEVLTANSTSTFDNHSSTTIEGPTSEPWQFGSEDTELVDGSTIETPTISKEWLMVHENTGNKYYDTVFSVDGFQEAVHGGDIGIDGAIPVVSLPDGSVTNGVYGFDPGDPTTKQELQDTVDEFGYEGVGEAMKEQLDKSTSRLNMFHVLWEWIEQEAELVKDNLNEVANNTYGQLQTGDLTIEEFVQANPAFAASEYATDYESTGHYSYAAALMASVGVAYDFEHEMKVELNDGTTMQGTMLVSDDDFSVSPGDTVDPADFAGQVYFAYSGETAERELATSEYQESIDGGVITLTTTPVEDTRYTILTNSDEFLHLTDEDWQPVDESAAVDPEQTTDWTYDATDELEDAIAQVESITNHYPDGTGAGMVRIENPFTILEAYNTETGDPVDEVTGEQGDDLSDTDTQFTQEDIEAFRQMVEAVNEESGPSDHSSGDVNINLGSILDESDLPSAREVIAAAAVVVAVLFGISSVTS